MFRRLTPWQMPAIAKAGRCDLRPAFASFLSTRRLGDFDRFDFDIDLDLVADRQAAALEEHVPGQSEIPPIDLSVCAEASTLAAPRVLGLAFKLYVQSDPPRHVANRQ